MNRKHFENTHEEALDRLCFVCGEIIKDSLYYDVEDNLELLGVVLAYLVFRI